MDGGSFHDVLKVKMDEFAHLIYNLSRRFPKDAGWRSGVGVNIFYIFLLKKNT